MFGIFGNRNGRRRRQVWERRSRSAGLPRALWASRFFSLNSLLVAALLIGIGAVSLIGDSTTHYSVGQRLEHPIYAAIDFQVPDEKQTAAAKEAARAATPSYYTLNSPALTFDRVRAELRRVFQAATDAETFEGFAQAMKELGIPAETASYERLRKLVDAPEEVGHAQYQSWIDKLPLESQFVVRGLIREPREPASARDFIVLESTDEEGRPRQTQIPHADLVPQGREKALHGAASDVSRVVPFDLRSTVEAVVVAVFQEQPTLLYNQERTETAMRDAEEGTSPVVIAHVKGKPFIQPGPLSPDALELFKAHEATYADFLAEDVPEAKVVRRERLLRTAGLSILVLLLAVSLVVFGGLQPAHGAIHPFRTFAFVSLMIATLVAVRVVDMKWPEIPELAFAPCLFSAAVLAIAYRRRVAMGSMCILAIIVATVVRADVGFLLTLLCGVVAISFQLNEVRSRTKLITAGSLTALAMMVVSAAAGTFDGRTFESIRAHALWAGACALFAMFSVSGLLPIIERLFRNATALTLLEWRDPTRKLLQLLAREAPGTYNHSLVLGTMAEAACERIGANGLLAQVGALFHDIGKIPKADYFTENQGGGANRHDKLAPSMSLLIILGHVKDGLEMAREYKLPVVLHQFIAEHHGTTVIRYFHHMASEKVAQTASGRHDREISEAEFRYPGPKPRTRESAVLMLCDGVEGAVRSLSEPTPGRIESIVHQIVIDRLNDGQLDDCDITLREVRLVEESLVKSLCSIYHGRVSYPKARKIRETPPQALRVSV